MHPVLIEIGRFKLYSYGLMLALSFWVGIVWAAHRASRRGVKGETIYDLSIILIFAAVLGSRALYILTHRADYHTLLDVVALWQGGATFYGGFILAIAGAIVFLRKKRIPFWAVADICAPSIALGYGLTRIGCFLSGCCFGLPAGAGLGIVFPARSPAGFTCPGVPLQPIQLYAALAGAAIAGALVLIERKSSFSGFVFAWLCILYGAERFIEDLFRYYEPSARIGAHLTQSQAESAALAAAGVVLLAVLSARARRAGGAPGVS